MEKFKLGPLQEKWLTILETHPERQMKGSLGSGTLENYKACCLGVAAIVCGTGRFNDINVLMDEYNIRSDAYLLNFEIMGLRDKAGRSLKTFNGGYRTLTDANDNGVTWTKIAEEIRKDPTNFFTKSA